MKQKLIELRDKAVVKKYVDPVVELVEVGDYLISYCIEDCFIKLQKTLAISKKDKSIIDREEVMKIPSLSEVFDLDKSILTICKYPNRGYTVVFIMLDKENT